MKNAVILLSGGLDSATVLALARQQGFACHCLSLDYGQRSSSELLAAARVAKALGAATHRVLKLDLLRFRRTVEGRQRAARETWRDATEPPVRFSHFPLSRNRTEPARMVSVLPNLSPPPMTSRRPVPLPQLRQLAIILCLVATALTARADIAVLREKGPHSGSAFSNPGLIADAPAGLKVAMKNADVKIHLRPGDGDTLKADVTADFELEDSSPAELAGQLYLVGFPVTGLSSKIVTIDSFAVTVDGKTPAMVLRQCIGTHFRSMRAEDTPLNGKLATEAINEKSPSAWSVQYGGKIYYRSSYIWQQTTAPAKSVRVHVVYSVTLHSQSIHYSKTYDSDEDGDTVIPFKTLNVDDWNDRHFFFDYALRSGATWAGLIGTETILVSADPLLGLSVREIVPMEFRRSGELERQKTAEQVAGYEPEENDLRQSSQWNQDEKAHTVRFTLHNEEPEYDLLIAIPLSAIKRAK